MKTNTILATLLALLLTSGGAVRGGGRKDSRSQHPLESSRRSKGGADRGNSRGESSSGNWRSSSGHTVRPLPSVSRDRPSGSGSERRPSSSAGTVRNLPSVSRDRPSGSASERRPSSSAGTVRNLPPVSQDRGGSRDSRGRSADTWRSSSGHTVRSLPSVSRQPESSSDRPFSRIREPEPRSGPESRPGVSEPDAASPPASARRPPQDERPGSMHRAPDARPTHGGDIHGSSSRRPDGDRHHSRDNRHHDVRERTSDGKHDRDRSTGFSSGHHFGGSHASASHHRVYRSDRHHGSHTYYRSPYHHSRRGYHRPYCRPVHYRYGYRVRRIPSTCVSISVGGFGFYYGAGIFYDYVDTDYVIVRAPVGAVVPLVPFGCRVVLVGGTTYYTMYGTYYRRIPDGYVVVADPYTATDDADDASEASEEAGHTVWITNPNGSRTPVHIREADGGQWVGPEGEYYDEFPTAEQLLPIYGLGMGQPPPVALEPAPAGDNERTVWILNANGSRTPVVLARGDGDTWLGPYGEVYDTLPDEGQLRPVYGLPAPQVDASAEGAEE